jgi:hypothetical protein
MGASPGKKKAKITTKLTPDELERIFKDGEKARQRAVEQAAKNLSPRVKRSK